MMTKEKLIRELQIGDWVYNTYNSQPEQVAEIWSDLVMLDYNDLYNLDDIEPIPITREVLEENGFNEVEGHLPRHVWMSETEKTCIIEISIYDKPVNGVRILTRMHTECRGGVNKVHNCELEYVHQLQNAIRQCNIDKEIKITTYGR